MFEGVFDSLSSFFSGEASLTVTLLFFTAIIALYSLFVYYFYRFLAQKNIIGLNLNQYNLYEHPAMVKFFAFLFYIVEYVVLLPILTFVWFAVLSILTLVLAEGIDVSTALLISAALVASVRVTSYVSEDLSRDLAKMLPFTLLAVAITRPGFFLVDALLSRITEIPSLFNNILAYLLFIVVIELVMRLIDVTTNFFRNTKGELGTEKEDDEEEE